MLGLVFGFALGGPLRDLGRVERGRDADDDVGGEQLAPVVGLDGDSVLDLGFPELVDDGIHFEREVHVFRGSIAHELELAVGRDEGDDPVRVEPAQFDALMELAVFQRDASGRGFGGLGARRVPGRGGEAVGVEEQAVVEAEFAFGHAGQVGPHDDLPVDVGSQHGARGGHEEVDVFNHIDKGLVLPVFDIGPPPRERPRSLHGDFGRVFRRSLRLDALGGDVHFERIGFRVLRVPKIQNLCGRAEKRTPKKTSFSMKTPTIQRGRKKKKPL